MNLKTLALIVSIIRSIYPQVRPYLIDLIDNPESDVDEAIIEALDFVMLYNYTTKEALEDAL